MTSPAKTERAALELLAKAGDQGLYRDELQTALGALGTFALDRLVAAGKVRVYPGLCYYATAWGRKSLERANVAAARSSS